MALLRLGLSAGRGTAWISDPLPACDAPPTGYLTWQDGLTRPCWEAATILLRSMHTGSIRRCQTGTSERGQSLWATGCRVWWMYSGLAGPRNERCSLRCFQLCVFSIRRTFPDLKWLRCWEECSASKTQGQTGPSTHVSVIPTESCFDPDDNSLPLRTGGGAYIHGHVGVLPLTPQA